MLNNNSKKHRVFMLTLMLFLFTFISLVSYAFPNLSNGKYIGKNGNYSLFIELKQHKKHMHAKVIAAGKNCTGYLEAKGYFEGNDLLLKPKRVTRNEKCQLKMSFDETGKKAVIEETNCSNYHGQFCSFNGKVFFSSQETALK